MSAVVAQNPDESEIGCRLPPGNFIVGFEANNAH